MLIYNVGFVNVNGKHDSTELNVEEQNTVDEEIIELINLILSLKDEMSIKEITSIDYMECEEE